MIRETATAGQRAAHGGRAGACRARRGALAGGAPAGGAMLSRVKLRP